jgi:hypothetical protein
MSIADEIAAAMADLQAAAQEFMRDACTISARTDTTVNGVTKPIYGAPITTACQWIADENGVELVDGTLRLVSEARATVLLPRGIAVTARDLVTFGGRKWDVLIASPVDHLTAYQTIRVKETK